MRGNVSHERGDKMFNCRELKAALARANMTQKKLASMIGVSEQTMIRRMKLGNFSTDEVSAIMSVLDLSDPAPIFFAEKVAYEATVKR